MVVGKGPPWLSPLALRGAAWCGAFLHCTLHAPSHTHTHTYTPLPPPPPPTHLLQGVISVTSNVIPGLFCSLMQQVGGWEEGRWWWNACRGEERSNGRSAALPFCLAYNSPALPVVPQRDDATAASLDALIAWLFCEPNPIPL